MATDTNCSKENVNSVLGKKFHSDDGQALDSGRVSNGEPAEYLFLEMHKCDWARP